MTMVFPRILHWTCLMASILVLVLMVPAVCDARRHGRRSRDEVTSRSSSTREAREGRRRGDTRDAVPQNRRNRLESVSGGAAGENCEDCIQAPSISIRVTGGRTVRTRHDRTRGSHSGSRVQRPRSRDRERRPVSRHRTSPSDRARGSHSGSHVQRPRSRDRERRPVSRHRTSTSDRESTSPGSLRRNSPGDELSRRERGRKSRNQSSRRISSTRHTDARQPEKHGRTESLQAVEKLTTLQSREHKQRQLLDTMQERQLEYRRQREQRRQFGRLERQQQHTQDKDGEDSNGKSTSAHAATPDKNADNSPSLPESSSGDSLRQSEKRRKPSRKRKSKSASENNGKSPQTKKKQKSARKSSRRKSPSTSPAPSPRNYRNSGWGSRFFSALLPTDTDEEDTAEEQSSENSDSTTSSPSRRNGSRKKNKKQSETKDTSLSDPLQTSVDVSKTRETSLANEKRSGSRGGGHRNRAGRRRSHGGRRRHRPGSSGKTHRGNAKHDRERDNGKERDRGRENDNGGQRERDEELEHSSGEERNTGRGDGEGNVGELHGREREDMEGNNGERLSRGREDKERKNSEQLSREREDRERNAGEQRSRGREDRARNIDEQLNRGREDRGRNNGEQLNRGREDRGRNNGEQLNRGREDRGRNNGEQLNRRREDRGRNNGEQLNRGREDRGRNNGEQLNRGREDRGRNNGEQLNRGREDRGRNNGEQLNRGREDRGRNNGEQLNRGREDRGRNNGEQLNRGREDRGRNNGEQLNRGREDRGRNNGEQLNRGREARERNNGEQLNRGRAARERNNGKETDNERKIGAENDDDMNKGSSMNRGKVRHRSRGNDRRNGRQRGLEGRVGTGRRFGEWRHGAVYSHTDTNDFPRRPAAADRLEQRLSPDLRYASRSLMRSMQRILTTLSGAIEGVKVDNNFIFNGTRYTIMMGVRKQLREISKANDMVYGTILRTALLVKDIYMRAHQSLLTGPTTRSLSRPEVNMPSLYDIRRKTYNEQQQANQLLRTVQNIQRGSFRLDSRLRQVTERFQDNFARNDLRTLVYYVNSTAQKLSSELTFSTQAAYIKRNHGILYSSRDSLNEARDLLYKAGESLSRGANSYRGNYAVVNNYRRRKGTDRNLRASASFHRHRQSADLQNDRETGRRRMTPAERRRLRPVIEKVKRHATEQERLATYVESTLRPSIITGKAFLEGGDDVAASSLLSSLYSRLNRDGKKLYSMLDSIRILIGMKEEMVWVTKPSTACREDDEDGVEGSGCLVEGSGEVELPGGGDREEGSGMLPSITDDEDFVFVDEKEDKKQPAKHKAPTSLAEFGQQLSVYVDGVKLRSNDILQRGDQLYEATDKLSKRWSDVKAKFNTADLVQRSWKQTKKLLQNFTSYQETIHELAGDLNKEISRSYDLIWERMKKAVEIAEQRLAEANARKAGGDTEQPANDDTIVVEAVEKAQNARNQWRETATLRTVAPQSCGRASAQVMRLHSNISHLRQQVNAAKALLQSMQLSISKSGSGYLSIPLSKKIASSHAESGSSLTTSTPLSPEVTWVTTVEVSIQTQNTDGPVLLIKGNKSATFSLSVDDRQMSLTVYDAEGYSQETITSDVTMDEDRWYSVQVTRTGQRVVLRVTPFEGEQEPVDNDATVDSMAYLQPNPIHAYIGGVADGEPFSVGSDTWRGCLGDLFVNGQRVSLFHPTNTGEAPQYCESSVRKNRNSLVFDGMGLLHFPTSVMPRRPFVNPVSFRFRTWQSNAALLHIASQRQRYLLRVMLDDGALMVHSVTSSGLSILLSKRRDYNDGKFHSLEIRYQRGQPTPVIDDEEGAFKKMRRQQHSLSNVADGVVAGAFITKSYSFEKSKHRPLIGCLQKIQADDVPLALSQAVRSIGVFSGTCNSRTLWSQCVNFGLDSSGIDFGALKHSGTIFLLFSPEARGPLLVYSREGKFEAQIAATDDGLQVTTEEDDSLIQKPDDITDQFTLLTVTDNGKIVKCSAWGEEVETEYGGFWDTAADVDGAHTVQLGLALDPASDTQLIGSVSSLMIGDRYINLADYILPNKLESCQRPLPDLVMSKVEPEVTTTSTDDVEATCSKDIKC